MRNQVRILAYKNSFPAVFGQLSWKNFMELEKAGLKTERECISTVISVLQKSCLVRRTLL